MMDNDALVLVWVGIGVLAVLVIALLAYYSQAQCPSCDRYGTVRYLHPTRSGQKDQRYRVNPLLCSACGYNSHTEAVKKWQEEARSPNAQQAAYAQALQKIASAPTAASRRAAWREGERSVIDPQLRTRLGLAVCTLDVGEVFKKVAGLKTAAAKRRHLQAALDTLKADDLPDELQASELQQIGEALCELGPETTPSPRATPTPKASTEAEPDTDQKIDALLKGRD